MRWIHPMAFFTDPVLQAPTWGAMFMCLSSALLGVILFIRRHMLMGEVVSHATFPGMIVGIFLITPLGLTRCLPYAIVLGAFVFGWLGFWLVQQLERHSKLSPDASLCFILSFFLGLGVLLASRLQFAYPVMYQQIQIFLYGQAATMQTGSIGYYALFSIGVILALCCYFPQIRMAHFDATFSRTLGVNVFYMRSIITILVLCSVVLGIRSVGVLLMAGMFIAPAVAARQHTHDLARMFLLAGFFGLLSGYLGMVLSINGSVYLSSVLHRTVSLPTGPMIMLCAGAITLFSCLFATERGLCARLIRRVRFSYRCIIENILKALYKQNQPMSLKDLRRRFGSRFMVLYFAIVDLKLRRWVQKGTQGYRLTLPGTEKARRILRLHRLWELYLVEKMGVDPMAVHTQAEEMEHILTPELEQELTALLNNPKRDPHNQYIPEGT